MPDEVERSTVDRLLADYLSRAPDAAEAYREDAAYHLQISVVRQVCAAVDRAMEDEYIREDVRLRVLCAALYGDALDADEAIARIERQHGELTATRQGFPRRTGTCRDH